MVAGVVSATATIGGATAAATGALATLVGGTATAAATSAVATVIGGTMAGATNALAATVGGATAAVTGALASAVSGVTTVTTSALTMVGGFIPGPVGWAVLGVTEEQTSALYTFDCWKPVLHDESTEPSNGKILREVAADPRIKEITIALNNSNIDLPHLILKNIWDEEFRIDYVYLPSIGLAAHADRI